MISWIWRSAGIRGHVGTATIWHEKLDHLIEQLPDGSDRITVVKINSEPEPTILINTYMPTMGSANAEYEEILDEVHELLQKFTGYNVIWTGDINAMTQRPKPTKNDDQFKAFCSENDLIASNKMPTNPTFHHFNGVSTSQIDLFIFIHHSLAENPIKQITIQSRNPLNTSMHDPVTAILSMKLPVKTTNKAKTTPLPMKPCWGKVDKDVYESTTEINLKALADHIEGMPPTIIADRLNVILTKCAESALPPTKQRRKRTSKHKWLRSFKPYAQAVNKTYRALMLLDPKDRKQAHSTINTKLRSICYDRYRDKQQLDKGKKNKQPSFTHAKTTTEKTLQADKAEATSP